VELHWARAQAQSQVVNGLQRLAQEPVPKVLTSIHAVIVVTDATNGKQV